MIEALNRDCHCASLDREALQRALEADPAARGLHQMITERCPQLFAALPLFAHGGGRLRARIDDAPFAAGREPEPVPQVHQIAAVAA